MTNRWPVALAGAVLTVSALANAATFPDRTVRFVVPFPPGGGNDTVARVTGQKLAESWGQNVVIDNRGGGGGNIGLEIAAKAAPDGYTLLLGSFTTLVINPNVYPNLPFDTLKSFAPVSQLASSALMVVVHPSLNARSVQELTALARAQPGKINYAAGSTAGFLAGELFKSLAAVDMVHIPYKGNAQALTDVMGGQISLYFGGILAAQPHVRTGRLRALAVTGSRRSPAVPELPTVAEAGVPGYEVDSWYGVLAPKGTPRDILGAINQRILKALESQDVREHLARQGAAAAGGTPEAFDAYLKKEMSRWSPIIRKAGLRPD